MSHVLTKPKARPPCSGDAWKAGCYLNLWTQPSPSGWVQTPPMGLRRFLEDFWFMVGFCSQTCIEKMKSLERRDHMGRYAQWSSQEVWRQYVLGQPLYSLELFTFTSKLTIKTCSRSSLEYHNPWSGASYTHSLAGCTSLPVKPLGMLGQMVSHVIQGVGSGCIWELRWQDDPLPRCRTDEEFSFGQPFKDTVSTSSVCSPKKTAAWRETARLKDTDDIECLPGNCNKATLFMHRWEIAVLKGRLDSAGAFTPD